MSLFDPEMARRGRVIRTLLLAVISLALAAVLSPVASAQEAQEVPAAAATDTPAPAAEQPADGGTPAEQAPVAVDPAPQPEPQPQPEPPPPPPPEAQQPAESPTTSPTVEEPVTDRGSESAGRDTATSTASTSPQPAAITFTVAPAAPAPAVADLPAVAAQPLGWDVYDDALFAESVDGDESAALLGDGMPPSIGGFGVLAIAHPSERDRRTAAEPPTRANATPAGGSGPGGPGPGPGQSLGLFGAGGGSGGGIALLTLLGLACGWFLMAPGARRALRTSTATWRPSAYVPPIEHPG